MKAWTVSLKGEFIMTVFFLPSITRMEVMESLIMDDGLPQDIDVREDLS